MTLKTWNNERVTNYDLNNMFSEAITLTGMNNIRQNIAGTITYSKGQQEGWSEAYIDADGRNNSVVAGSTTATFSGTGVYLTNAGSKVIFHTLPGSTFPAGMTRAIGIPMFEKFESGTGFNARFKLTNAVSDTDWINYGTIGSFAAFATQPTFMIVELTQRTSAPTGSTPSIYGFWVRGT